MKKILILILAYFMFVSASYAGKLPDDVQSMIKKSFPTADIRFDGVIILPDGTLYLPLNPARYKKVQRIEIAKTYPENTTFDKKPDAVIFNNDFTLLKVLNNSDGTKTIAKFDKIPSEIKSGLLPQDMLVPKNMIIPENLRSIAGNLTIRIAPEEDIKIAPAQIEYEKPKMVFSIKQANRVASIPELKDKVLYISTHYIKDIHVIKGESNTAEYALAQKTVPNVIRMTPDNKFLLVSAFNSTLINVISIADDRIIKQIDLTTQAGDIVIDEAKNCAYIASPTVATIYQVSLKDMTLKKKIKINGRCEKLFLGDGYLIYTDKMTNKIWSIELDNDYALKDLGTYPNISKILYSAGKVYVVSRTKSHVAVIDYKNQTLLAEFDVVKKPIDMLIYDNALYILSAEENVVQVIDKNNLELITMIQIGNDGFSTKMVRVPNSTIVLIPDAKLGTYSIIDIKKKAFLKTNVLTMPVSNIIVGKPIRKI